MSTPATAPLDVLCVGFGCMDLLFPFRGLPRYDRKNEFDGLVIEGGGPASTAAVALHRLGLDVGLITALGSDAWGRYALERLAAELVPTQQVYVHEGARTPLSIILCDPDGGARTILWDRGTVPPLSAAEVASRWQPARAVLVDEIYPEGATEAMRLAHRSGIPVIFDAGTAGPGLDELVAGVDYLITSQHFPSRWTGIEDPQAALAELQARNRRPVISTRGAEGCWMHDGHELIRFPAVPVAAVDTTGAGDAFHAAVVFGVLRGWSLARCCRFACHYASQSCLQLGGRAGLLWHHQLADWLAAGPGAAEKTAR